MNTTTNTPASSNQEKPQIIDDAKKKPAAQPGKQHPSATKPRPDPYIHNGYVLVL